MDEPPRHVLEEAGVEAVGAGRARRRSSAWSPADGQVVGRLDVPRRAARPARLGADRCGARASAFVPGLRRAKVVGVRACARPQSLDGRPLVGEVPGQRGAVGGRGPRALGHLDGPGHCADRGGRAARQGRGAGAAVGGARLGRRRRLGVGPDDHGVGHLDDLRDRKARVLGVAADRLFALGLVDADSAEPRRPPRARSCGSSARRPDARPPWWSARQLPRAPRRSASRRDGECRIAPLPASFRIVVATVVDRMQPFHSVSLRKYELGSYEEMCAAHTLGRAGALQHRPRRVRQARAATGSRWSGRTGRATSGA